ncbi:TetR/AcrR family transcriptional regulator [Mycobacterium neglectum]|jgi:AcrR family transcriptional regulator|uniref:TetR/AcrR family transcriptional regulator n=1 Tax=Mycobacterium neglectum TaxID=242737 RepID=UPI000BFEE74D|nr:TetR/AcrR family transcriptional regulator [Mycobacterium neglectum]
MPSPRERMVISAALLIRERGAHPTAIADVLEHSGAPRGSAYHYFPGGRTQLLCEAIDYAGAYIAAKIANAQSGVDALDKLFADYRKQLLKTDFRAGCPVVAVSVEAGDPEKPDAATPVIERAAVAFSRWTDLIAARLISDGVSTERAAELAMLTTTSFEGAIVVSRASRNIKALDLVHDQLRTLVLAETSERTLNEEVKPPSSW